MRGELKMLMSRNKETINERKILISEYKQVYVYLCVYQMSNKYCNS